MSHVCIWKRIFCSQIVVYVDMYLCTHDTVSIIFPLLRWWTGIFPPPSTSGKWRWVLVPEEIIIWLIGWGESGGEA